ncbi:MAG: serine hydrolase family protein [Candidatus Omnitrophica bacterium]|nr:serine hydrolase family protein [Candidatus Omnitrophota bacterium]
MRDFKIIFVHGYTASSKADWYPNIAPKLKKLRVDFSIPDLPGGEHPRAKEWLDTIHREVFKTKKSLVLVGHSLGSRAVLLYLEKYKPKVKLVILIAAFANRVANAKRNKGKAYPDFFVHKINTDKIKKLSDKFIVMHSKDDDSIPYKQGKEIAKDLGAKLITYQGRGHFYNPENAPVILNIIRKELKI